MLEEDLLRFQWVADPRISPDGSRIAFTLVSVDQEADEYRTHLWLVDVPAGKAAPAAPRQLTFGGRDSQPRWSPDGRTLAFVRKPDAEGDAQIHLLPLEGGEPRKLTTLKGGTGSPAWSPDGTRIVCTSGHNPVIDTPDFKKPKHEPARVVTRAEWRWNNEGFTDWDHLDHLWVVDVSTGTMRALTKGTRFRESAPRFSRDGKHVLYITDRREQPWFGRPAEDNDVRALPADLAEPTEGDDAVVVADIAGPIAAFVEGEGGRIAAVGGVRSEQPNSYDISDLLLFDGAWPMRTPRVLTQGSDLAIGEGINSDQHPPRGGGEPPLGFTADGGIVCSYAWRGAAPLARVDLATGTLEALTDSAHEVIAGSVAANGQRVALTLGSLRSTGELCVYDLPSRTLTPLFDPNAELLAAAALGDIEELNWTMPDGVAIQGWVVKPPGFDPSKQYPLIVEIHGGPHTAYGVGFFHEFRVLASAGNLVLYTNPRGSTSYGQDFANRLQYQMPSTEHEDVLAGVDLLIQRGWVDESRMGVTGGSYGGLLTNWIIAHSHRFKAALTQRCVADWSNMWSSCDFAMFNPFWFRGAPWEEQADFIQRSPATWIDKIETPLMVIHSEEDWRTPIAQGEMMFRGLLYRKKPVVMVRFPGENHELSRSGMPSRRVQNQQHIRRWFDHWLHGKAAPEYGV